MRKTIAYWIYILSRSFKPIYIAQLWEVNGNRSLALQIEHYIKKLSRKEKLHLIDHPLSLSSVWMDVKTAPRDEPFDWTVTNAQCKDEFER